jgi:hypothetical protein
VGAGILLIVIYLIFCRLEPVEIILTLTAVIIYVYTYETYELRRATVDHTEIYTRPVLILRMDLDNRDQKVFLRLHNHGHSPAYNVEFKETELNMEMPEGYQWKLKLEDVDVVPPEKEILVSLASGPDESIYEWVTSEQLFSRINSTRVRHGRYSFKTIAVYEDILGHTWKSELGFNSTFGIIAKKPDAIERKTRAQKKGGETD